MNEIKKLYIIYCNKRSSKTKKRIEVEVEEDFVCVRSRREKNRVEGPTLATQNIYLVS
jgi:hypothetical protein